MSNPFDVLRDGLRPFLELQLKRNDRYIYPEIQQLEQALNDFHPEMPNSKRKFIELVGAIRDALKHIEKSIEKGHISFTTIGPPIDTFVTKFNLPRIHWESFLFYGNTSPKFFDTLTTPNAEVELLPWLAALSAAKTTRDTPETLMEMLLEYKEHFGFTQKLGEHLKTDPDFLFRLIMKSEENFSQIARTRMVLYLTDKQLAEAIVEHIPCFVQNNPNPVEQAQKVVEKLNEILSNGRSVSTVLRNAEAKLILESSQLIKTYQNEDMDPTQSVVATSPASPSSGETGFKSGM